MVDIVLGVPAHHFEIFGSVILPVVVEVMYQFSFRQPPPDLLLRDNPVFIGIPTNVSQVVDFANENQNITVRCNHWFACPVPRLLALGKFHVKPFRFSWINSYRISISIEPKVFFPLPSTLPQNLFTALSVFAASTK